MVPCHIFHEHEVEFSRGTWRPIFIINCCFQHFWCWCALFLARQNPTNLTDDQYHLWKAALLSRTTTAFMAGKVMRSWQMRLCHHVFVVGTVHASHKPPTMTTALRMLERDTFKNTSAVTSVQHHPVFFKKLWALQHPDSPRLLQLLDLAGRRDGSRRVFPNEAGHRKVCIALGSFQGLQTFAVVTHSIPPYALSSVNICKQYMLQICWREKKNAPTRAVSPPLAQTCKKKKNQQPFGAPALSGSLTRMERELR